MPVQKNNGFTYMMVLAAIVIIGIGASVAARSWIIIERMDQEEELLFRGIAVRHGIEAYYKTAHAGFNMYPGNMGDLVHNPENPAHRFLRRLYTDPITGGEWEIILDASGRLKGVRSQSKKKPLKQANFPEGLSHFSGASTYRDWVFEYTAPLINQ